jgi:hypothetical protein
MHEYATNYPTKRRYTLKERELAYDMQSSFSLYEPEVRWLYEQALRESSVEAMPQFIGQGRHFHVFSLSGDEDLAVKLPLPLRTTRETQILTREDMYSAIIENAGGLLKGVNRLGLEQLVAFSPFTVPAIITKRVKGPTLKKLINSGEISRVETNAYEHLLQVFINTYNLFLDVDRHPTNVLYADEEFTIIDYLESYHKPPHTLYDMIVGFAGPRMLLYGLRKGQTVPLHAMLYREACKQSMGAKWSKAITDLWTASGFEVPSGHYF